MNKLGAPLAACALTFVALGGASTGGAQQSRGCRTVEGDVMSYSPIASGSCPGPIAVGQSIYRNEKISSGTSGGVTFETKHIYRCVQLADPHGTADRLYPKAGIALKHLRGTTWCDHHASDPSNTLTVPGATIQLQGTIIGIHTNQHGSVIKVAIGKARVTTTLTRQTITIGPNSQAFIAAKQPLPPRRQPLTLTPQEQQLVFSLESGVIAMGDLSQPGSYLKLKKQTRAVVVGQDAATAQAETTALKNDGVRSLAMTFAQVSNNPKTVLAYANKIMATTVIVIGDPIATPPIVKAIASVLPSTFTLLTVISG